MSGTNTDPPPTAGENPSVSTVVYPAGAGGDPVGITDMPFQDVNVSDPNPDQLESATVTETGPVSAALMLPALSNLSPNALALALDQVQLTFDDATQGTDAVTATITDTAGQSTTLTSTATQVIAQAQYALTITSQPETTAVAQQTITGTALAQEVETDGSGTIVSSMPAANTAVMLYNLTTGAVTTTATDSGGNFSFNVTLPSPGAYTFVAQAHAPDTAPNSSNQVTDTLQPPPAAPPAPITVSEPDPSVYGYNVGSGMDVVEAVEPFNGVVFNDPNPGVTEAVTFSSNGQPVAAGFGPGSQPQDGLDLTPAQVASYLDDVDLTNDSQNTVTATITDSDGETAALTSTIVGGSGAAGNGNTVANVRIFNSNETSSDPSQTISGSASIDNPYTGGGVLVGTYPLTGATVTLTDNGLPLGTATTDGEGDFSTTVTLPDLGGNVIVATVSSEGSTAFTAPLTDTLLASASPITVSEPNSTTSSVNLGSSNDIIEGSFPFSDVAFSDPNAGVTETIVVSLSGPAPASVYVLGSLGDPDAVDGLTPAQVASSLEALRLTFDQGAVGTDMVTATITDSDGQTAVLTSTVNAFSPTDTDTLALFLSQRAEPAGAQFTVSVDGQQAGGVQTVTANTLAGQTQEIDLRGNFPAGPNKVAITYLNANNSLLLLNSVTINGTAVPGASTVLSNDGSEGFTFTEPPNPSATAVGSGPDTLALFLSERGEPAGAQFTVSVDGTQVGGVQTTAANVLTGQAQEFDLKGNFPTGTDAVTVTYLHASNSLLFVDSATLDNTAVPGSSLVLSNTGSASFSIIGPSAGVPTSVSTVGAGPDTLALDISQRAEPAGAQFTIAIDGTQIGGVQTASADSTAGQFQQLDVLGNFAPGVDHTATITYLNANNSLLLVDGATINGSTIAGGSTVLSNNGRLGFSFELPARPQPLTIGSGPDTLALSLSQAAGQADAQFTLSVDNTQVGGVQTVTANGVNGQSQLLDVLGAFSGTHTATVDFLNPAAGGGSGAGAANSLFVNGATIDGSAIANTTLTFTSGGSQSFTFTH